MTTKVSDLITEESIEVASTPADPEINTQQARRAKARRAIEDLQANKRLKKRLDSEEYFF